MNNLVKKYIQKDIISSTPLSLPCQGMVGLVMIDLVK